MGTDEHVSIGRIKVWEDEDLIASYKKQQEEEAAREQQEALAKEEAAKRKLRSCFELSAIYITFARNKRNALFYE